MLLKLNGYLDGKKGFTLIELLVVIAIIGVLATIIIINVNGAREKAEKTKIQSEMTSAIKIVAACKTFGGTVLWENFYYNPTATGEIICDSTGADSSGIDAMSGNWPVVTSKFQAESIGDGREGVQVVKGGTDAVLVCTSTGCSGEGGW